MQNQDISKVGTQISPLVTSMPVFVVGMSSPVKLREGKLSPDGRPTYGTNTILRVKNRNGEIESSKSASVNVINPPKEGEYALGQLYVSQGKSYITAYQDNNNRISYSILCENLIPYQEKPQP